MPKTSSLTYQLPEVFSQYLNADINNPKIPKILSMEDDKGSPADIVSKLWPDPAKHLTNGGITRNDMVFIDGKPVSAYIPRKVAAFGDSRSAHLGDIRREQMGKDIIAAALVSGKHRVTAVTLENDNGRLEPKVQDIKPDLKLLGDTNKKEYSFIRRTFFNWGPFKCVPRMQKAEALNNEPYPPEIKGKLDSNVSGLLVRINYSLKQPKAAKTAERQDTGKQRTDIKQLRNEQEMDNDGPVSTAQLLRQKKQLINEKVKEPISTSHKPRLPEEMNAHEKRKL